MTENQPGVDLVRKAAIDLRCLAHYASSLADTLDLACSGEMPHNLGRLRAPSLTELDGVSATLERLLHNSLTRLDRQRAHAAILVADLIRRKG